MCCESGVHRPAFDPPVEVVDWLRYEGLAATDDPADAGRYLELADV